MIKNIIIFVMIILCPCFSFAQTDGMIKGTVTDSETDEPLAGVNIFIPEKGIGTLSNSDGQFEFANLPVGEYSLEISCIGYETKLIENITLQDSNVTRINVKLNVEDINLNGKIVGTLEQDWASDKITYADIEALPVRNVENYIHLNPGVIEQDGQIYIRGGGARENVYFIGGTAAINPYNFVPAVHIIPEAIDEIEMMTGNVPPKIGDANSGIIQTTLKNGTADFHFSVDLQTDKFADEGNKFFGTTSYRDHILAATVSGPIITDKILFFAALENEDISDTRKRFSKSFTFYDLVDMNPYNLNVNNGNPDTVKVLHYPDGFTPGNSSNRWAVNSSLIFKFNPFNVHLTALYDWQRLYSDTRPMLNILNQRKQYRDFNNLFLSGKLTHFINNKNYYNISLSYLSNTSEIKDDYFGCDWRSWADSSRIAEHTNGEVIYRDHWRPQYDYRFNGFNFSRNGKLLNDYAIFKHRFFNISGDFGSAHFKNHLLQAGFSYRKHNLRQFIIDPTVMQETDHYGSENEVPATEWNRYIDNTFGYNRFGDEIDDGFDGPKEPVFAALYIEDRFQYNDLIINGGLRFDYLDPKNRYLINPANPEIDPNTGQIKEDQWKYKDAEKYISPRIGILFSLNPYTNFYINYNKFVQSSSLYNIYSGYHYQAVVGGYYYITNFAGYNFNPVQTTSYELGMQKFISNFISLNICGFYKNTKEMIEAKGLEFLITTRRKFRLKTRFHYTFSKIENVSFNNTYVYVSSVYRSQSSNDSYLVNYDHTHSAFLNLDYRFGGDDGGFLLEQSSINLLFRLSSGHPFTKVIYNSGQTDPYDAGVGYMIDTRSRTAIEERNSSRTDWIHSVDLRIDKTINLIKNLKTTFYIRVTNLFNTKIAINVYPATGQADDDGFISDSQKYEQYYNQYGGQKYLDMYNAINIENGQAYWDALGLQLYNHPRQILFGVKITY